MLTENHTIKVKCPHRLFNNWPFTMIKRNNIVLSNGSNFLQFVLLNRCMTTKVGQSFNIESCESFHFCFKTLIRKNGFRGDCQSEVSDVSSLDLYTFFSINSDAYKTLKTLQIRLKDKKD
jgi:hypothetical protein